MKKRSTSAQMYPGIAIAKARSDSIREKEARSLVALMATIITSIALSLLALLAIAGNARAFEIKEVTSPGGIKALLVEDYTVPIISMGFSLTGGQTQDPEGKAGAMKMLSSLLDEGAGEFDNIEFQRKAEAIGAEFGFSVNRDDFTGGIRMLKSEMSASFDLLDLALNEPRIDEGPLERVRAVYKESIERNRFRPSVLGGKALRESLYGDHPYGIDGNGTPESLDAISREDLLGLKKRVFARENLFIGVVGAITPEELGRELDDLFGSWPEKADLKPVPEADLNFGETLKVDLNTPQANIQMVLPGIEREDPDFFAAHLMNHILGGGTFSSRLYQEVREKRGLAYSVYSYLATYDRAALLSAGSSTRADQAQDAIDVILGELEKMAKEGPSEAELEAAKKYVYGSYAIANLDNSGNIARTLVSIQREGLGKDYIERRGEYINSVTLDDVKRVASELLSNKPTIVIVGPASS